MTIINIEALAPLRGSIPRVLIVDDEPDLRELIELTVVKLGFDVETADTVTTARNVLSRQAISLCLTDMRLPDGDGIELVRLVNEQLSGTPIAVITAFGSTEAAVAALKAGAFDFLSKPVSLEQLRTTILAALQTQETVKTRRAPGASLANQPERAVLGDSLAMQEVRMTIARLARSMAPVAIYGESGTGKEVAARAIHAASARGAKPFVAVNCGAIPDTLMEAEFFGYRKGSFTGAEADRDGFFQAASGGTLMLDEIAELPLGMQVKLLRAIQERRVRKVGATVEEPVDVRIISATHRNLPERVAEGLFRQDLFYRLNVIEMRMPPLRDRADDVQPLADAILSRLASAEGRAKPRHLSADALAELQRYNFPGNVRELENILERASAFAIDDSITGVDLGLTPSAHLTIPSVYEVLQRSTVTETTPFMAPDDLLDDLDADPTIGLEPLNIPTITGGALPPAAEEYIRQLVFPISLPEILEAIERAIIEMGLEQTKFNRTAAAKLLGLTFRQLRYRMQQLNIH